MTGRPAANDRYKKCVVRLQMKAADLEWYLASQGIVETEMDENPARARGANSIKMRRGKAGRSTRGGGDSDEESEDDRHDDHDDYDDYS